MSLFQIKRLNRFRSPLLRPGKRIVIGKSTIQLLRIPGSRALEDHAAGFGGMVVQQHIVRGLLVAQDLEHDQHVAHGRGDHDDPDEEHGEGADGERKQRRQDAQDDQRRQRADDVGALAQGLGTGAVRRQGVAHDAELDVLEPVLREETPGQTMDELVHDDQGEVRDEDDDEIHDGHRAPGIRVQRVEDRQAYGEQRNDDDDRHDVRLDEADVQIRAHIALLGKTVARGAECVQTPLLGLGECSFLLGAQGDAS